MLPPTPHLDEDGTETTEDMNGLPVTPPVFPLTPAQFRTAVHTGHGRAMRHILEYGVSGLDEILISTAMFCPVYDAQVEDERAAWLVEMMSHAHLNLKAFETIKDALHIEPSVENYWDREHRCSVIMELAKHAVAGARDLLYAMFTQSAVTSSLADQDQPDDLVGVDQIVELDGINGLLFIARKLGQCETQDPTLFVDHALLDAFDQREGSPIAREILEKAAKDDVDIQRFLLALGSPDDDDEEEAVLTGGGTYEQRMGRITAHDVIAHVRKDPDHGCIWLREWGLQADENARLTVFAALLDETSPLRLACFLRAFSATGPPYFSARLIPWIDVMEDEVGFVATQVLAHVSDPNLRDIAISRLTQAEPDINFIPLLTRSYLEGDHEIIENALCMIDDVDERHALLYDVLDLFEVNRVVGAAGSLIYVYEYTPCTNCRLRALELLTTLERLPDWIAEESKLDASEETRTFMTQNSTRHHETI